MLLRFWDNGFETANRPQNKEHPIDATTQPPRPHPYRLRRPPPGGQCRAAPSRHPGPASRPARTRPAAPRLGRCPGAGEHGRQDDDAGGLRAGWGRLHRRRRCVAHRGDGLHPGRHGQGAIHPGHLPAQLPLGPRPPTGPSTRPPTRARCTRRTRPAASRGSWPGCTRPAPPAKPEWCTFAPPHGLTCLRPSRDGYDTHGRSSTPSQSGRGAGSATTSSFGTGPLAWGYMGFQPGTAIHSSPTPRMRSTTSCGGAVG